MTHNARLRRRHVGFTLLELLVVLAVIAILATIAAPNFQEMLKNNRVSSQTNELIALLIFARSEAVRRSIPIIVNIDLSLEESDRWVAEILEPQDGTVLRRTGNTRVKLESPDAELKTFTLTFNSRGYLGDSTDPDEWNVGGAYLCLKHVNPSTSGRQHRVMHILPSGQIDVESNTWSQCPPPPPSTT